MLQNPKFPFVVAAIGGLCMMVWMFSSGSDEEQSRRRRSVPGPQSAIVNPVILCHDHVRNRVVGTGVTADFPSFMDGARGAEHLGGTAYSLRSHVDLIDGQETSRLHYYCAVEDGVVIAFNSNE